jgi:putative endonuclease
MPATRPPKPVTEWSDPRHRRGYAGEKAAISHLLKQGWRIEAHRFRLGHHDLDVIARLGSLVAFIEVKTRRSSRFGQGVEAVGPRKRAVMTRLADLWRVRFGLPGDRYRFDVIAIDQPGASSTSPQLTHIEDAWRGVGK